MGELSEGEKPVEEKDCWGRRLSTEIRGRGRLMGKAGEVIEENDIGGERGLLGRVGRGSEER